jgi:hypothetical protein
MTPRRDVSVGSISFFTLWDWRTLQRAEHALRIAGDHRQRGASRLIVFSAALFPIAQHALRECDNGKQIPPGVRPKARRKRGFPFYLRTCLRHNIL